MRFHVGDDRRGLLEGLSHYRGRRTEDRFDSPAVSAFSTTAVDVPAVVDVDHANEASLLWAFARDLRHVVVDLVQDAVATAARRPRAEEFTLQLVADAARCSQ